MAIRKELSGDVIINETAALTFGWRNPVGKQFYSEYEHNRTYYTVVGVVKDFSYLPPTIAPRPLAFVRTEEQKYLWSRASILFKFTEGSWEACKDTIRKMKEEDFPSSFLRLYNEEEEYNKYLRSESALMTLLGIVSIVCVIISIFGIFSQVTLSCEQRRKEIAIRKVNGATIGKYPADVHQRIFRPFACRGSYSIPGKLWNDESVDRKLRQTNFPPHFDIYRPACRYRYHHRHQYLLESVECSQTKSGGSSKNRIKKDLII